MSIAKARSSAMYKGSAAFGGGMCPSRTRSSSMCALTCTYSYNDSEKKEKTNDAVRNGVSKENNTDGSYSNA